MFAYWVPSGTLPQRWLKQCITSANLKVNNNTTNPKLAGLFFVRFVKEWIGQMESLQTCVYHDCSLYCFFFRYKLYGIKKDKKKRTFHYGQPDTDLKWQPNDLQYSLKSAQIEVTDDHHLKDTGRVKLNNLLSTAQWAKANKKLNPFTVISMLKYNHKNCFFSSKATNSKQKEDSSWVTS